MLKINFKIDKTYLAYEAIATRVAGEEERTFVQDRAGRQHLREFKAAAEKRDPLACLFMKADGKIFRIMTLANHAGLCSEELAKRTENLLLEMTANPLFAPLLEDSHNAVTNLEAEWDSKYSESLKIVEALTGFSFDKTFDVYVTHPCQPAGHNSYGTIFTTFRKGFPNYNTVYLWHEILHSYIEPAAGDYVDNERSSHSVIQLITDNELRVRMGGGNYPPFEGHDYLNETMECLLPAWRDYLKQDKHDALAFLKIADKLEKERTSKSAGERSKK